MNKSDIAFWKAYRLGNLKRELTVEEEMIIKECDKLLDMFLPSKSFYEYYKKLQTQNWSEYQILHILTMTFRVPISFIEVRINDVNKKSELNDESININDSIAKNTNARIRGNLSFWKVYKLDKLNRELLPLEKIRVEECDNAMEVLVEDEIFIPLYEFLKEMETNERVITMLATRFKVPTDIIEVKIYEYEKGKNAEIEGPRLVK